MTDEFKYAFLDLRIRSGPIDADPDDIWWSAHDKVYANWDPYDEEVTGSHSVIELHPWFVSKRTPKGVWVNQRFGKPVFVLGKAIRQLCVPTQELAIRDLIERKKKHVRMSELRTKQARYHLALAEKALLKVERNNTND